MTSVISRETAIPAGRSGAIKARGIHNALDVAAGSANATLAAAMASSSRPRIWRR